MSNNSGPIFLSNAKPTQSSVHRSSLTSHWGILFAIIAILVTTLLSWKELAAQQTIITTGNGDQQTSVAPNLNSGEIQSQISAAADAQNHVARLTFEDIDFNRGWRKGKSGWVRIQNYHVEPPVALNLVQRISPIFWAVSLWLFAIVVLVLAS